MLTDIKDWLFGLPDITDIEHGTCIDCEHRTLIWGNYACNLTKDIIFKKELFIRFCGDWGRRGDAKEKEAE